MFLHHWVLQGIDSEFIVPLKNSWDMHSFAFVNPEKIFVVLADSMQRGGLILEMRNLIATMFPNNS